METKEKNSALALYENLEGITKKFLRVCKGMKGYVLDNLSLYLKKEVVFREKLIEEENAMSEKEEREGFSTQEFMEYYNYLNLEELIEETDEIVKIITYSMIVSLVSAFDYFVLSLLEKVSNSKIGVAKFQQTKISYEEIESCSNFESVKKYYTKKYLDELFRKNHDDIFEEIKNKFHIEDIKNFDEYKQLLYITEIRNLIVHNDGFKSIQLKNNITKYELQGIKIKFSFDKKCRLDLSVDSILKVLDVFQIIALKIHNKFIVQFFNSDEGIIDKSSRFLTDVCLQRYNQKHPEIGLEIFDTLLKNAQKLDDKYLYVINKAMCMKALGDKGYEELINSLPWDKADNRYILAKYLLLEDLDKAMDCIKLEDKEEMDLAFRQWPLCKKLVKTSNFKKYYLETYGEEFKSFKKEWTATVEEYNTRRKSKVASTEK